MLETNTIHLGDCLESMKKMSDNSVDAVVTDPPYGLSFMGKKWDYDVPSAEIREEALRVLKPGGYLLAFAGTRTQHRMAVRIEDAGFEIRDMIAWVYGSGFPKSLNIGKKVDQLQGNEREDLGYNPNGRQNCEGKQMDTMGGKMQWSNITKGKSEWEGWGTALKPSLESITVAQKTLDCGSLLNILIRDNIYILKKELCQLPALVGIAEKHLMSNQQEGEEKQNPSIAEWIVEENTNIQEDLPVVIDMLQYLSTENINLNIVLGWLSILVELYNQMNIYTIETKTSLTIDLKTLSLLEFETIYQNIIQDKNNQTNGLSVNVYSAESLFKGLKLKLKTIQEHFAQESAMSMVGEQGLHPNLSPIIMSRKPLSEKTVAENCLKWGTGGINIDGCRVEILSEQDKKQGWSGSKTSNKCNSVVNAFGVDNFDEINRTPNDLGRFPANLIHDGSDEVVELFPNTKSGAMNGVYKNTMMKGQPGVRDGKEVHLVQQASEGSASRFFYCAKASKSERNRGCECIEKGCNHPTVKPIALMEYLVKLVSRENAIVLDPFAGSGSTLIACKKLGRQYIGCEMSEEYIQIAEARLNAYEKDPKKLL